MPPAQPTSRGSGGPALLVQTPEGVVQDRGEGDPEEVGEQEGGGRAGEGPGGEDGGEDGEGHQDDHDEGGAHRVGAEEDGGPACVEEELDGEEEQGDAGGGPVADEEVKGDAHQCVEGDPDGAEDPAGRVEGGLLQGLVPGAAAGVGGEGANGAGRLAEEDAADQQGDAGERAHARIVWARA